jgi:DNA-directed RNA polymerase specialized sigma24 family protein
MVAVQSGDRSALAMLYDRYQHQLLSIGLRALGGQAEAEDVLHDVFVEAWQRAGQYDRANLASDEDAIALPRPKEVCRHLASRDAR